MTSTEIIRLAHGYHPDLYDQDGNPRFLSSSSPGCNSKLVANIDTLDSNKKLQAETSEFIQDEKQLSNVDKYLMPEYRVRQIMCLYYTLKRFVKGFAVGYMGKFTYSFVGALAKTHGNPQKLYNYMKSIVFNEYTIGYGLFLGGFSTIFEQIMRFTLEYSKKGISRRILVLISSFFASFAFFALPQASRLTISMFFFVRAIEIGAKHLREKGLLPDFQYADTLLMAVASSQVLWAWIFNRDSLESSYAHFLDYQGGRDHSVYKSFVVVGQSGVEFLSQQTKLMQDVNLWRAKHNISPLILAPGATASELIHDILHPHTSSCTTHFFQYFQAAYFRAIPVYIPIYVLPLVCFRFKSLFKHPLANIVSTATGIGRSSLFLSTYCSVAWYVACIISKIYKHSTLTGFIGGFCAGLSVAIEKKGRRIELALYVLTQAIPSFTRTLQYYHILPKIKHFEFVVFLFSMCVIMNSYIIQPHFLRRNYLSSLKFVFGSRDGYFHTNNQSEDVTLMKSI